MLAVLAGLLAVLGAPACAQSEAATVRLDGRPLFRVQAVGGADARTRARTFEQQLVALAESGSRPIPVRVAPGRSADQRLLVAGETVLGAVTGRDADAYDTDLSALAAHWAQLMEYELAQARNRRQSPGDRFVNEVRGSVEAAFGRVLESAVLVIPRLLAGLIVLGVFWLIAAGLRLAMRLLFKRTISDLTVENLLEQAAYYAVWAVGLLIAANALGFDPEALATGLGLTSLALGFALKDVLSNFVSGLLILFLRPFGLGDQIVIGDTEGSVERIQLRATIIRTYDGRMISVPNAETFTSRITNNTAAPIRRGTVAVRVDYTADLRLAAREIEEAARTSEGVLPVPPVSVRVESLDPEAVLMHVRFWTDSRRSDHVSTASRVRLAVVERFREQGLPLPDPVMQVEILPSHKR